MGENATEQPGQSSSSPSTSKNKETDAEQDAEAGPTTSTAGQAKNDERGEKGDKSAEEEQNEAVLTEEDLIQQSQAEYDSGRYSPRLLTTSELPLDTHTITPEEDTHRLQLARRQLQVTGMRSRTHKHTHSASNPDLRQKLTSLTYSLSLVR